MLHDGWGHLFANTVPLLILGFLVLMSGIGRGLAATGIIWVIGGVGTWLTGGVDSHHVGASVLVFGWLTYLLVRGIFTRSIGQILIGVVVLFVYGGMLWGVLPGQITGSRGRGICSERSAASSRRGCCRPDAQAPKRAAVGTPDPLRRTEAL